MKKVYVILFCFIILPLQLFAQKDYNVGLSAGINFSKVNGNWAKMFQVENINPGYITGARVGLFLEMQVSKKFSVEPQLHFSQKGVYFYEELSGSQTIDNSQITYNGYSELSERIHYLSLPVLFKYRINNFSVFTGLYFSKLLTAKLDGKSSVEYTETDLTTNTTTHHRVSDSHHYNGTNGFNATDIGMVAGIDYIFPFGMGLEAGIENGFSNTFNLQWLNDKFNNSGFYAGLKFRF